MLWKNHKLLNKARENKNYKNQQKPLSKTLPQQGKTKGDVGKKEKGVKEKLCPREDW